MAHSTETGWALVAEDEEQCASWYGHMPIEKVLGEYTLMLGALDQDGDLIGSVEGPDNDIYEKVYTNWRHAVLDLNAVGYRLQYVVKGAPLDKANSYLQVLLSYGFGLI